MNTLLLAPMQEVTNLAFWTVLHRRGGADVYVTEYFRVHPQSKPDDFILESIIHNPTGRPVVAQMIGNEAPLLVKTARALQSYPISGIDLNLGCPAPVVCGKNSGGALLRDPGRVRDIVHRLREVVTGTLSLKTRVGFETDDEFKRLLDLYAELPIDSLAVHGRTVREKYQSPVHTDAIAAAVAALPYPVYANGSIVSVETAHAMRRKTGAAGLMIGRGAIRNPWLFAMIRGECVTPPTLRDVYQYVQELDEEVRRRARKFQELGHVQRMKKYLNYVASGIGDGSFLHEIRRVTTPAEYEEACRRHLDSDDPMPEDPDQASGLFRGFRELAAAEEENLRHA